MYCLNKKCNYCKLYIAIEKEEFIQEKDKYYHFECYIKNILDKQKNKKNKLNREQVEIQARKLQEKCSGKIKATVEMEYFIRWLQNAYCIVAIPQYILDKIDSVVNGTYNGLSKGIPISDLHNMWKIKKTSFDKIANMKKTRNEEIDEVNRIAYDLAIIVSKYDNYLQWKEQQKLIEKEHTQFQTNVEEKINYNIVNNIISINQKNETEINDILDELF